MGRTQKTKEQLLQESAELRAQLARLENTQAAFTGAMTDATERKQAEEVLRESEERYRAIFEQAADSIVLIEGKTGALVEFNDRACENLGYTREEFQKLKISDFEVIESAGEVSKHIEKIIRQGRDVFETKHRTKDGHIRDILVNSKTISTHGKDFVQSIWRDITDRKQAEDKLRLHSEIMTNMVEGIYLIRADDSVIVYTNPKFAEMFGYGPDEMVGKHVSIVNAPTDKSPEETAREIKESLNKTGEWRGEINNIKKDGTRFWCYANVSVFEHAEYGKVLVSVHTDITDRKEAEKLIRYQRDFENLVTEISTRFINLPADRTGHGIEQALKVLGQFAGVDRAYVFHSSEELSELTNTHEWCADGIESYINDLQHVSFDSVPWWMDELRKLEVIQVPSVKNLPPEASGEKKIFQAESIKSLIAVPMVYDDRLIGFIGFDSVRTEKTWGEKSITLLRIIAEIFVNTIMRHKSQQELENYHHKMFRAEQLASLGTISATIAHELNQPLTVIQLLLQQSCRALGRKKPDIDKIVENLNDCLGEVSRTVTTVDRFRKFAIKSSPIDVCKVDLAKTALAIVSVLKRTAKQAKLTMSVNIDKSPLFIRGNITEFEQIFFVVIQNAIQAADAKRARKLKISLSSASGQILLEFADTCGGVAPENADRIFEPFFTTKPGEVGTGLGLCILERIVKRYNGLLRFENKPGHGITFYIALPVKS